MILDDHVKFEEIKTIAYNLESTILKDVNLFDEYKGKNIGDKKKSFAVSFTFNDSKKTLTDNIIDKVMTKFADSLNQNLEQLLEINKLIIKFFSLSNYFFINNIFTKRKVTIYNTFWCYLNDTVCNRLSKKALSLVLKRTVPLKLISELLKAVIDSRSRWFVGSSIKSTLGFFPS